VTWLCLDGGESDVDAVDLKDTLSVPEVAPGDGCRDGSDAAFRDGERSSGDEFIQDLTGEEGQ
jgi:hypothetical protein